MNPIPGCNCDFCRGGAQDYTSETTTNVDITSYGKDNIRYIDSRDNSLLPLDELLSPAALARLKQQGYVCFKIQDDRGEWKGGWISRKTSTKTVVEREAIVLNCNMDPM
jgi:hypothetical protein